ncbi:MAG: phage holin family protein [candidate division FCPU426 bacterium]
MRIEIDGSKRPASKLSALISHWLINSLGLLLVSRSIKGIEFQGSGFEEAASVFAAAAVLGLINVALKPFLVLLTLPINILSLGLFTLVINAGCLGIVTLVIDGFKIDSFWSALLGALMLSLISMLLNAVVIAGGFKVRIKK